MKLRKGLENLVFVIMFLLVCWLFWLAIASLLDIWPYEKHTKNIYGQYVYIMQ